MVYKNSQIYNIFILSKPNIINNFVITIYIYISGKKNEYFINASFLK